MPRRYTVRLARKRLKRFLDSKAATYTGEGRLPALELKEYLVSFYQNRSSGLGPSQSRKAFREGGREEEISRITT